jgi:hypothetical protein
MEIAFGGQFYLRTRKFLATFGDVVARAGHANVPLRRQSWEYARLLSRNIDPPVNFGSMR